MGRTPFVREINRVIFTPDNADVVGIYENPFTTVDTELTDVRAKFITSAVVGNKVIFTPYNANFVGIFDVDVYDTDPDPNNAFTTVDTGLEGGSKFNSSALVTLFV